MDAYIVCPAVRGKIRVFMYDNGYRLESKNGPLRVDCYCVYNMRLPRFHHHRILLLSVYSLNVINRYGDIIKKKKS